MKSTRLAMPDLLLLEPTVFGDERGYFYESFNLREFSKLVGRDVSFVQDNHSCSSRNVLRGLHYQIEHTQAKLIRVIHGAVLDVAVDIRRSSPSFGRYIAVELSAENKRLLWMPEGFAHGFVVLSEHAELLYKASDYYYPEHERCIRWDDPTLNINWQLQERPILSARDMRASTLSEAALFDC